MNEIITSDVEILRALMVVVKRRRRRVSAAAVNAVLDICATEVGRRRLCAVSALEKLMSVFLQDANSPSKYIFLCRIWRESSSAGERIKGDDFPLLILEATVILTNTCSIEQLMNIRDELLEIFLSFLKQFWVYIRDQSSQRNIENGSKGRDNFFCNVKSDDLAESIFRLSIKSGHCATCISEVVKRSIFGPNESDYEHFISNYWEDSPFLLRDLRAAKPLNDGNNMFSFVDQSFNSKVTLHAIIPSIVGGLVSCPPLPSDELDILNFLTEQKNRLGQPILYGQDIRVLKTVDVNLGPNQGNSKREVHFLKETTSSCISAPDSNDMVDVEKCIIACHEGYTIALRGLEFRSQKIASVAEELAVLFGQPSVGANAYLTPPRSQGLARHYDDHCVFVCQLHGQKQWTVYPRSTSRLPRLYEPLGNSLSSEGHDVSKCQHFLLQEGAILYIPRGCPHEAFTTGDADDPQLNNMSTGFSFHLTFGIEVEPPFEWEGFAHIALHIWNLKKNHPKPANPLSWTLNFMSINLLHIAIQQIGGLDPIFAKACMVAIFRSHSDTGDGQSSNALSQEHRTTFSYIINRIDNKTNFLEALKSIEVTIRDKNEDIFLRMRWMRHLYPDEDSKNIFDWDNPLRDFETLFLLCEEHRSEAETTFMQIKSKFCNEIIFDDVCEGFEKLLQKYRRARAQYMKGMLSLHCTSTIFK